MKIVRTTFTVGNAAKEYFFDRPYDEALDDTKNCDGALNYLINATHDCETIAVMHKKAKEMLPVILNLKNIIELNILTVGVYAPASDVVPTDNVVPFVAEEKVD